MASKCSPDDDEEIKTKFHIHLKKPYYRRLIFILSTVGVWPHDTMGQKKWFTVVKNYRILFPFWLFATLSCISYVKKHYNELRFIDICACYINILMIGIGAQRVLLARSDMYKQTTKDFFCKLHLYHHKNQHEYARKMYNTAESIAKWLCVLGISEVYPGSTLYVLVPVYKSYMRGMFQSVRPANATFAQAIYYDLPFDYDNSIWGFSVVYFMNIFVTFDIGVIFMVIDYYMMVIVAHMWGHIKILKYNLRSFPRPINATGNNILCPPWYNEEESKHIRDLLVANIEHYRITGKFIKQVSTTFETTLCCYFFFFQISLCIFLLQMSLLNVEVFITYGILTVAFLQQIITMSVMFELIGSQSDTIKDALYEVPWECMGVKNRKLFLFFLCIVQQPVHIKALGLVPVGVQTMSSILKNTISYFMLLRTTANT